MTSNALPPTWDHDLQLLKRWFLVYLVPWFAFWVALIKGAADDVDALLVVLALAPYIVSIVYAYRVQRDLNVAGLYKSGAWQVIVGALLLNPIVLGWVIPLSVLWVARRVRSTHAA